MVRLASHLLVDALPEAMRSNSPRGWAYTLLGVYHHTKVFAGDVYVYRAGKKLADKLMDLFKRVSSPEWPWCENILTYANASIPHALILAGKMFEDENMTKTGLEALKWLLTIQTKEKGQISIIGNKGWKVRNGQTARFDQQPIDAGALVEACSDAYRATNQLFWVYEASRCVRWFLGYNDLQASLFDPETGGCKDGLSATGPNENQGAESTLAWLLSLTAMYKLPKDVYDQKIDGGASTVEKDAFVVV